MAITTIRDIMATGPMQLHQRIPHLVRCGISENVKMVNGKMVCKHCGEPLAHPRAAAAHLAVHHKGKLEMNSDGLTGEHALRMPMKAYGTSEGSTKGWDSRGRGRAALQKAGFKNKGTDSYGYKNYQMNKDGVQHKIQLAQNSGQWTHSTLTGDKTTNGKGGDALAKFLDSGKHLSGAGKPGGADAAHKTIEDAIDYHRGGAQDEESEEGKTTGIAVQYEKTAQRLEDFRDHMEEGNLDKASKMANSEKNEHAQSSMKQALYHLGKK